MGVEVKVVCVKVETNAIAPLVIIMLLLLYAP